jgi:hypothetical protein
MVYNVVMHRSQIFLEEWQYETLKARAERTGLSISEVVRVILNEHLAEDQNKALHLLESLNGIGKSKHQARNLDERLYKK